VQKILKKSQQYLSIFSIIGFLIFGSQCAYFNTYYNAEQYFKEGQKELKKVQEGQISAQAKKNFNIAIDKANKVLANYPDSRWTDNALYIIAMSNYFKMDYSTSRRNFEEYFAKYPASGLRSQAEIWYGRCLWKLGERELALHQLNRSGQNVKDNDIKAEIYSAIAELYQSSNQLDSARQYYKKTTKISTDPEIAAKAQYNIAEIDLLQNDMELAVKDLKAVSKYAPSKELKDRMQVLLTRIYREAGMYAKARELINTKLNDVANENIWGDLEYQLGLIYLAEQDYESASLRFSQITEKYSGKPVSAQAYYQLGLLNMKYFHDYEKAQKSFSMVARENKTSEFVFDAKNKELEIKRYFSIRKNLEKAWKDAEPFDLSLRGIADSNDVALEDDARPEDLKKAIEYHEQEKRKDADTTAIFNKYYQSLYEIGELYYFNFEQSDSAFNYFNKINKSQYFNSFQDKSLYALYYIFDEIGDSVKSSAYLDTLRFLYPDSPYLAFIEKREAVLPSEEMQARQLFWDAEKWLDSNVDSAITVFNSVYRQYPATYYAEKSVLNIAWIYHHKYYDLDNAIKWYKIFLDEYPESENISLVKPVHNNLAGIYTAMNAPPADTTKSVSTEDSFLEEKTIDDSAEKGINKIIDVAPADTTKSESKTNSFLEEKTIDDNAEKPSAVKERDELEK